MATGKQRTLPSLLAASFTMQSPETHEATIVHSSNARNSAVFSDHVAPCNIFTAVGFFLSRSFLFQFYYGNVVLANVLKPQDRQVSALHYGHSDRRSDGRRLGCSRKRRRTSEPSELCG